MDIFDFSPTTRALLAAAIALVPAIAVYVRGRRLARFADNPALPEQLFAGRHTTGSWLVFAVFTLVMLTGKAAIWGIPLCVMAYIAAGLPLRRVLYNETWSLAAYLWFVVRFFIAGWSFWLLVSALPALALWSADRTWIAALLMGAGLFLLADRQPETIRWVIGARPISDESMRARFERLVSAANVATPHFEVVELKGGSIANAVALPSLGRSSVIFTGPLLQRLEPDEVDAICAHEIAHLEYYNPRRLRRHRLISRSLIAGGAALTPLVQLLVPSLVWLACAAWPSVVLIAIAILVHDRQKHETASDLRGVALSGNPEALVRGLVKLHAIARVPRRWDADLERHMSHPSLKRRIQDIRAAAGTAPASLGATSAFESPDGASRAVFGDETLEWIEGATASYRLQYERLAELRLDATRTGEATLLVADRSGHRWQMPLQTQDVARLQAVLDIVDVRVKTDAPGNVFQPILARAATLTVFILSINSGLVGVSLVLAMAMARPEAPLLCAAAVAAIAGALLGWRNPGSIYGYMPVEFEATFAVGLAAGGLLLAWLAYLRRRDEVTPNAWKLVGVIAAASLASWLLPIAGRGIDAVGLHQSARDWPSTVMLPLALAGAMLWSGRKAVRIASAAAVAASVSGAWFGSQAFLDRFGGDLFLKPAPEVSVRTLAAPFKAFTVPFSVSDLQLSPGGTAIAAAARRRDGRTAIHIGRAGATLTRIDADGALFVDDDRALVWSVDGSRTELREVRASAPETASWQLLVTGLATPAVSLDRRTGQWRLTTPAGANVIESRDGVIGTDRINSFRWNVPQRHGVPLMPIAVSGDRSLAIEPRPDLSSSMRDPLGTLVFVLASAPHWRSTLWALGPEGATDLGTSRLELQCHLLPLANRGVCHIFDASRTRFFAMDAATREITAIASLPGRFLAGEEPQGNWITGWSRSGPVAVRLGPVDAIRVVDPLGADAHMLALADRAAAGVWHHFPATPALGVGAVYERSGTATIRIFPIE